MNERVQSDPTDPETDRILSISAIVAAYWLVAAAWRWPTAPGRAATSSRSGSPTSNEWGRWAGWPVLQTVARRQQLALVPTDLSSLVESHRADLAGLMPASVQVEIETDADPGDPPTVVALDPAHFPQVILDLAANARDAMPDGGTLRVAVRRTSDRGVLVVTDTGRGMSDDELRHCFEPFFTTKPTGKGTGLGLALTYGLVHQSGGEIAVRSDPGNGTTFEISLPLAAPAASVG